jgi:hypothetical protein
VQYFNTNLAGYLQYLKYPKNTCFSLVAQNPATGTTTEVGKKVTIVLNPGETLNFVLNDWPNDYSNNSGSIKVDYSGIIMSHSSSGRLWAIQQNDVWTRWAPEYSRWDIYSETRLQIAADPSTPSACYFINPDGSVHWRNVDANVNKSFPGIVAKAISVGGDNRLWAIQQNGVWTRWAPEYSRWDIYSETRLQIAADPSTPSACYFINPDGSVHWRNVDANVNKSFPGIVAKAISVGG